ncbi:hypothetical protein NBM05_13930 [Rothia sp. AR01]|uniref:Uncharacterized protein n=1 Tax=Rothia santali TaxID=2949643 RepID=A0A9X2HEY4_9MICC|nr:hypothetical protein [Rothia santali]MCP3427080.1 hypothetical protein [Rothia santali]
MDYVQGVPIYEVVDGGGQVAGVTLPVDELKKLDEYAQHLRREFDAPPPRTGVVGAQANVTRVAACAAGIAWFIAQTVFPAARIANLAFRLGRLVSRYGARTVARIFMGARGIAGRSAEREIIDLAKSLSGVAALGACGI